MAEDRIDSYIDRAGIKGDTDYMVAALNEVYAGFKKVETVKIDLKGVSGLAGLAPTMQQAKAGADSLAAATETVTKRMAEMNGTSKEFTNVLLQQVKAQKEAASASAAEAKAAEQLAKQKLAELKLREANEKVAQKEAVALEKTAAAKRLEQSIEGNSSIRQKAIAAKEAEEKAAIELAKSLESQAAAQVELNAAMASAAASGNQRAQLAGGASPAAAASVVEYRDELEKLTGTLTENESLQAIYKHELSQVNAEIKSLDRTSINYDKRLASLTNRQNVLKGEMASLNTTIKNQTVLENSAVGSLDALNARLNLLNQTYAKLGVTAQASPMGVRMKTEIQSLSTAVLAQEQALNRSQKNVGNYSNSITQAAGKTFSVIRKLAYVLPGIGIAGIFGLIASGIGSLLTGLFRVNKAFDESRESVKAYGAALKEANEQTIKNSAADVSKLEFLRDIITDLTKSTKDRTQAAIAYNEVADEANKLDLTQLNNLNEINDKISQQITLIEKRALSRAAESILADKAEALLLAKEEARLKAEKDVDNELIGIRAGATQAQIELDRKLAVERKINSNEKVKQARVEFEASKKALYGLIDVEGFVADKVKAKKDKKDPKDDAKKRADAILKAEFDAFQARKQLQSEISLFIIDSEQSTFDQKLRAAKDYFIINGNLIVEAAELEKKLGEKTAKEVYAIETKKNADLFRLKTEYYKKIAAIRKTNTDKEIEEEKKLQEEIQKNIEERYKRDMKNIEKLLKANQDRGEAELETEKKLAEEKKKLQAQLVSELTALTFTLFTAGIDREKNALQEQIDLLEQKKQKDIEVANQTILNAQDRAAAITVIEARAQAQREQLERKQRELDYKKAQFDKAASIARIIQETAIAIVQNLKFPALVPLVIAIGAAQLAAVIAQPIPRYKHGKNVHNDYEGPAIVGDGGKKEAIIREDGTVEVTADTPQLTYVKKRDVVLPDVNQLVNYVLAGNMGGRLAVGQQVSTENTQLTEIKSELKDVVKAIKSIPQPIIRAEGIISRRIRRGDSSNNYLNQNLQS